MEPKIEEILRKGGIKKLGREGRKQNLEEERKERRCQRNKT